MKREKKPEAPDVKRKSKIKPESELLVPYRPDDLYGEEWDIQFAKINIITEVTEDTPIGMIRLKPYGRRADDAPVEGGGIAVYVDGVITKSGVELPGGTMLYAKLPKQKENN
jgi:hypothetical protein